MQRQIYDLMLDHVRSIYRAATGADLPEAAGRGEPPPEDALLRRFAELDALARLVPTTAERVPPLSFQPPLEIIDRGHELVVQVAAPGVQREDVSVQILDGILVIAGLRHGEPTNGQVYRYSEIPRGPFRRALPLPIEAVRDSLRVEVKAGLIRVLFAKQGAQGGPVAKA